jgi:hypothetical protein
MRRFAFFLLITYALAVAGCAACRGPTLSPNNTEPLNCSRSIGKLS